MLAARLAPDLAVLEEPWTVIGSAALVMTGVPLRECADLDILTTEAGAAQLEAQWARWRQDDYRPDPAAAFRSRFSRYALPEGVVEVMGDLKLRKARGWSPVKVRASEVRAFGGVPMVVPTPVEQLRILREFGRPKDLAKAERLQAWLTAG